MLKEMGEQFFWPNEGVGVIIRSAKQYIPLASISHFMEPRKINEYHIFLASPGDMDAERQAVRQFFEEYNRHTASRWNVRFTIVDWENYSIVGVGRPQELITSQTLERFRRSLALVVGLMGQRFGSPTGSHESGTEEEFEWALTTHLETGYPEIKWFLRDVTTFQAPSDPQEIQQALDQWMRVRAFRERLENGNPPLFYGTFTDISDFTEVFRRDMSLWLSSDDRSWPMGREAGLEQISRGADLPSGYYAKIIQDFQSLDIAGIDNDRAVDIPLDKVYVRLRVIKDEDGVELEDTAVKDEGPIDIHAALGQYRRLVIVGDPGSGKSTFLKFIALMIARSQIEADAGLASANLNLQPPLPIPFFVSLWDLSDFIKRSDPHVENAISDFILSTLRDLTISISQEGLIEMLETGVCCLLFDGLDEVPTEHGRALISRLVERFAERFDTNRFVVTSRVRGYTGDTILKAQFIRCDIQDFNEGDRSEFLKNWFAVLLGLGRNHVLSQGSPSRLAYDALRTAIETKDRIRSLAVNPLLMTVIAIVHWNRKRLPDQRVDLYDECIDVLLGQRKAAERVGRYRSVGILDEAAEDQAQYDRAWTRKRFSEIALLILESGTDEVTRNDVIELLTPRFLDRGAATRERAAIEAEVFLDRQELRSGLLVSRRSHSCRFVHLTFQEYLAAWNLANESFERVKTTILLRLRENKWFETLQLLGGELAKSSDEKLDGYVVFLIDNMGDAIGEQAPVIALCANILQDVAGVADIKASTQREYTLALEGTLHAFHSESGVPARIQLEVLRALAHLGSSVKDHLIQATKSAYFQVRSEALALLVPHLPDDDLFGMMHVLQDRSQDTVFVYIASLFERDRERAVNLLMTEDRFTAKAGNAIVRFCYEYRETIDSRQIIAIVGSVFEKVPTYDFYQTVDYLFWHSNMFSWLFDAGDEFLDIVISAADTHAYPYARSRVIALLGGVDPRPDIVSALIRRKATTRDEDARVRETAVEYLRPQTDDDWDFMLRILNEDDSANVRLAALRSVARRADGMTNLDILRQRAHEDPSDHVRRTALSLIAERHVQYGSVDRKIITKDIDGFTPYWDPREPIDDEVVHRCSTKLQETPTQIWERFVRLAEILPLRLSR